MKHPFEEKLVVAQVIQYQAVLRSELHTALYIRGVGPIPRRGIRSHTFTYLQEGNHSKVVTKVKPHLDNSPGLPLLVPERH